MPRKEMKAIMEGKGAKQENRDIQRDN
jgi:hypothetical protein